MIAKPTKFPPDFSGLPGAMPKIRFFTHQDNQPHQTSPKPPRPKHKYRLTNWPEYNKALINRGLVTLWLDEKTLGQWYYQGPRTPGGLFRYSDECIRAALALKAIFGLAFRQTQGLIKSLLAIIKSDLPVPSYSQLCRRQARLPAFQPPAQAASDKSIHLAVDSTGLKMYGEGEWKVRKHGADKRRTWRKLHLAIDEATNRIHAVELTTASISDAQLIEPLVGAVKQPIAKLSGDGAYDQRKVYDELATRHIQPVIPPRSNAMIWRDQAGNELKHIRNDSIRAIEVLGLAEWKRQVGYHRRSKAETAIYRWKMIFGERLWARLLGHQQTEAQIKAICLNQFIELGMPKAVKWHSE